MLISGQVQTNTDSAILIRAVFDKDKLAVRITKMGGRCEVRLIDSRWLSAEQRKMIYATIGDIAKWYGDTKANVKTLFKGKFLDVYEEKDFGWFSLSDCSMELAFWFARYLIEFCFEWEVPSKASFLEICDDVEWQMQMALKYKKCAICRKPGEIHHVDAIGMGGNRKHIDDSGHRKICLCRGHHSEAHNIGWPEFKKLYHVKGILFKEKNYD